MTLIRSIRAREVLDSRGLPTVEVDLACDGGFGRAIVPSGASTGSHEAHESRDGDPARYQGKGVRGAVAAVNGEIADYVVGMDCAEQDEIDQALINLDGTDNKERLGANAVLGVSLAAAHAAASAAGLRLFEYLARFGSHQSLPTPMINIISGGLHAGKNLDFQDYLVVPGGADSIAQALEWTAAVRTHVALALARAGHSLLLADEGGFGPALESNRAALDLLTDSISAAGLEPGADVAIAIDVAAQHFFVDPGYRLAAESRRLEASELIEYLVGLTDRYPIVSIEDGLAEDDWCSWTELNGTLGNRIQVLGDDLFTTNPARLERGISTGAANAVLVKVNQIGTLTEALAALRRAQAANFATVVSARSGETEDSTIADLAVATGAGQIKIGSLARSERGAKYHQQLRIEDRAGAGSEYAGWAALAGK
ncbi:MAG: phosphopyruvate hydratase [Chloroflexi bacterium]|nr:phosphopyruvate hydratase [Chloroflexota bacterium]